MNLRPSVRIGKLFQAFPPLEPYMQVSLHTAQAVCLILIEGPFPLLLACGNRLAQQVLHVSLSVVLWLLQKQEGYFVPLRANQQIGVGVVQTKVFCTK